MIRIQKSDAPDVLTTRGRAKCDAHEDTLRNGGTLTSSDFDRSIYAHDSVKQTLIADQHRKCCFCESKITHVAYGDVEHFRPKSGYSQSVGDALHRPGYWWLAYAWDNLFLSCQLCNQRFKRSLFPLGNPGERAPGNHRDVSREDPLFLDPGADDPEVHIGFREAVAYPREESLRGEETIRTLDLNRDNVYELRRDRLKLRIELLCTFKIIIALLEKSPDKRAEVIRRYESLIEEWTQPEVEYASMMRDAVAAFEADAPQAE